MIRSWLSNRYGPLSKTLERELQPDFYSHHRYVILLLTIILLCTTVPAFFAGGISGLGKMLAIDGALFGFSGHIVRLYPNIRGWKVDNESKVSQSIENFQTGIETLDENGSLEVGQTGYEEAMRLIIDKYGVELEEPVPFEIEAEDEGLTEVGKRVHLEGVEISSSQDSISDGISLVKLKLDGHLYAKNEVESVVDEREVRRAHFKFIGSLLLLVGTLLLMASAFLTAIDFVKMLVGADR